MSDETPRNLDWLAAFKFGFTALPKNGFFLLSAGFIAISIPALLGQCFSNPLKTLLPQVLSSFLVCGYWTILLSLASGENPSFGQLFSKSQMFWKFLIANLLSTVAIIVGLVLFIVPGFIVTARLGLFPAAMADKGLGPIEAIKYSWKITKGQVKTILLLLLVNTLICLAFGLIFGLLLGLLISTVPSLYSQNFLAAVLAIIIPTVMMPVVLSFADVYRQLKTV